MADQVEMRMNARGKDTVERRMGGIREIRIRRIDCVGAFPHSPALSRRLSPSIPDE
jgi:hypothetical protein